MGEKVPTHGILVDPAFQINGRPASARVVAILLRQQKEIPAWLRSSITSHGDRVIFNVVPSIPDADRHSAAFNDWKQIYDSLQYASSSGEWNMASGATLDAAGGGTSLQTDSQLQPVTRAGEAFVPTDQDMDKQLLGFTCASGDRLAAIDKIYPVLAAAKPARSRIPGNQGLVIVGTRITHSSGETTQTSRAEVAHIILHELAAHAGLATKAGEKTTDRSALNAEWGHARGGTGERPPDRIDQFLKRVFKIDQEPEPEEQQVPQKPATAPEVLPTPQHSGRSVFGRMLHAAAALLEGQAHAEIPPPSRPPAETTEPALLQVQPNPLLNRLQTVPSLLVQQTNLRRESQGQVQAQRRLQEQMRRSTQDRLKAQAEQNRKFSEGATKRSRDLAAQALKRQDDFKKQMKDQQERLAKDRKFSADAMKRSEDRRKEVARQSKVLSDRLAKEQKERAIRNKPPRTLSNPSIGHGIGGFDIHRMGPVHPSGIGHMPALPTYARAMNITPGILGVYHPPPPPPSRPQPHLPGIHHGGGAQLPMHNFSQNAVFVLPG